ncbi:RNA polymerase II elongator-like protein [Coniochaeta ligniaria NRRL 30616]|uniref:Elongator complex protein 1 n=1 Tax=Coniochaeta ligniaria NRRL 30616 TaxID=1408157 RepID=A0A1J7II75_9PEZI|nr:RNA polymerase II elongator-like protein [Coniochaeta ligniaria NRRL 30616]
MRNLRNIRHSFWKGDVDFTATCWDAANDEVLATFGPTEQDSTIGLVRLSSSNASPKLLCKTVASWDAPSPDPDLTVDRIVSLHHFGENATTCLVLEGGDIIIVQETDASKDAHIEIVGSIDAGITAARWSPDEELLLITTKANTVLYMSRTFDGITEASMTAEDLKASKHVSVGWGKKETQFQGKGAKAKALRDPTIPETVDEGNLSSKDDGRETISWRGDGAYVAINSIQPGSRRVIRVYTREGVLDSVSEPVDFLEGSLSWRPSGNLIAGIRRTSDTKIEVVFFERNGLRHGQFELRIPADSRGAADDISLEWNSDSTVLAVILKDRVQLWTTGNYHWYLKQEIMTGSKRSCFSWHPEKALRFAAATSGKIIVQEYIFFTHRGSITPPNDFGVVGVIDGQILKITPFRTANVPPPMAMFEIETESSIIDVVFAPDNSKLWVLHHSGINTYSLGTKDSRCLAPRGSTRSVFNGTDERVPLQFSVSGDHGVRILSVSENSTVISSDPSAPESKDGAMSEIGADSVSSIGLYTVNGSPRIFAQEHFGRLLQVSFDTTEPLPVSFQTHLPWTEIVEHNGELLAFGLSKGGHLYVNSRQLVKNCTSFLVTPSHLIFTTSNHLLKFAHLDRPDDMEVPADDPEVDERCRSIERGAKLVTAMPTNMSLVLQMPRGNLETIFPRAMVVAGIRQLIDEMRYDKAFATCRTQRVDMNILYDHRPDLFLNNVSLFLEQLEDASYIDLFLSSLREEDVTQAMYKDTRPVTSQQFLPANQDAAQATTLTASTSSKVNSVCDAVLKTLQTHKNANLQNIITAHVCKSPPALDDALQMVAGLMSEDEALVERAVEHICFLADVNKLYDHALGLYNLDLALLVAQQSQRDPREYLPFIQNLHQLPSLRREFAIDDHLSRREKALGHLKSLNVFDEVQKYTVKHNLYKTALNLYRYDEASHKSLTELYASHLGSVSNFREAGLAYESVQNFAKATSCYSSAGATSWRECLFAASQQKPALSPESLAALAADLAEALYEAKDYAGAAAIHAEHLGDVREAIRCLCRGSLFADAMRLAVLRGRAELLETAVDGGLADALSGTTEFLADCKAQLKAQVPRIIELRRKAVEDPLGFYEGDARGGGGDIPDDVSVATSRVSTSASLFTRYTGKAGSVGTVGSNVSRATSKNRKREEKKRARGRKGTVYEEEYLVNSVRRLVERVEGTREEIERLVFGLVRRGMAERARAVEALVAEVVEGCKVAAEQVWPPAAKEVVARDEGEGENGYRAAGGAGVFLESLEAKTVKQEPPVIAGFSRLSLLG